MRTRQSTSRSREDDWATARGRGGGGGAARAALVAAAPDSRRWQRTRLHRRRLRLYAASLLEDDPASGGVADASSSDAEHEALRPLQLLAGDAEGHVALWRLGAPSRGAVEATIVWREKRAVGAGAVSRRLAACGRYRPADGGAQRSAGTAGSLVRHTASATCAEVDLPNSRSLRCDNQACDTPASLWNGTWQVPATVECPLCSSTFPVVNAVASSSVVSGRRLLRGYGKSLNGWGPLGASAVNEPDKARHTR